MAHLDGELPFYRRSLVQRHIEACWKCRLRLSEIERQVLQVTRAAEDDPFPGPERIARARAEFLVRADLVAAEVFASRQAAAPFPPARRLALALAGIAIAVALPGWLLLHRPALVSAAELVRRVETQEVQMAGKSVHQRIRVVLKQERPALVARENLLEVWSEPQHSRFAYRFRGGEGNLRLALWSRRDGAGQRYDAERPSEKVAVAREKARAQWDAVFRDGLTFDEFERSLIAWLRTREWRPVSLSSDFAVFTASRGAQLTVEPVSPDTLRLRARKSVGAATVEFTLEAGRQDFRPRLHSIRYESPERVMELQFRAEAADPVTAAAFEPELPSPPSEARVAASPAAPVSRPEPDPDLVELQARYALHKEGACLGEPVEVTNTAGGVITVTGVVVDTARKERLIAALSGLPLRMDLRSAAEELQRMGSDSLRTPPPAAPVRYEPKKPAEAVLAYFSGDEREAGRFLDKVSAAGEDVMKEAQALQQLARLRDRITPSASDSRELQERMMGDHLIAMRDKVDSVQRLLAPLYPEGQLNATGRTLPSLAAWEAESMSIFQLATEWNRTLQALSTRGAAPVGGLSGTSGIAAALRALRASLPDRLP